MTRQLAEKAEEAERRVGKFRGRELATSGKRRDQWRKLRELAEKQAKQWRDLAELERRIDRLDLDERIDHLENNRYGSGNGEPPRGGTLER